MEKKYRSPWILIGFLIGVTVSLFVQFGIRFLLFLIQSFNLPEQELFIFSSLFYGIIFFIARAGLQANSRLNKSLISRKPFEEPSPPPAGIKAVFNRVRFTLWVVFGVFSVLWLTPALVIYWTAPKHPQLGITACMFLFSLAGAAFFFWKNERKFKTYCDRLVFSAGTLLGTVSMVFLLP